MADNFIPYNTQLKKLRDKRLIVPSSAKRILEREGYHSIINGYRDPFKFKIHPEFEFINGTNFNEVYSLYKLDRDLRSAYLKKILKIEQAVRSAIAYEFTKSNKKNNRAYLDFRNFDYTRTHKNIMVRGRLETKYIGSDIHRVVSNLSSKLSNSHNKVLKHYITKHQQVPLWILINSLTMGELVYLYTFLKPAQRDKVSSRFNVSDDQFHWFIEQLKIYRNICAHEERFYCYTQGWGMINIWHLYITMINYLPNEECVLLTESIKSIFLKYESEFKTITFDTITTRMGFPNSWHR